MTTRTTCDACQADLGENGLSLWQRDTDAKVADFCNVVCLVDFVAQVKARAAEKDIADAVKR